MAYDDFSFPARFGSGDRLRGGRLDGGRLQLVQAEGLRSARYPRARARYHASAGQLGDAQGAPGAMEGGYDSKHTRSPRLAWWKCATDPDRAVPGPQGPNGAEDGEMAGENWSQARAVSQSHRDHGGHPRAGPAGRQLRHRYSAGDRDVLPSGTPHFRDQHGRGN